MSSTGHFPGAPHNTEPVTTMATSSSQPMVSPSSASYTVPQQPPGSQSQQGEPSSVSSQPAPSSVNPRSAPTDEPRAASSASNVPPAGDAPAADPGAEPGANPAADPGANPTAGQAGDPGTTSTDTTSTTTTDTTATTTTGTATTGTATTTTTTSTGTTATAAITGRITPPVSMETIFQEVIKRCNNCLFLVRKLRIKQDHITDLYLGNEDTHEFKHAAQLYKDFGVMMQEVMLLYDKLDHIARRLPQVLPPTDNLNVMRLLYTQEHTMYHTDIFGLIEKMIDSGNWNEGNYQIFFFLSELLRVPGGRKDNRYPDLFPLPEPRFHFHAVNGHMAFETAYNNMKKEIVIKSLGIYPKTLFRTSSSLIIEFLFGCGGGKVITDSDVVITIKFLVIERYGIVEYINMVAPNEGWDWVNNYGVPMLNPFTPSCYEVYRRLTRQANIHLLNCFGQHASRWTSTSLLQFVSLFGKFRDVFTARCRVCKKFLKNYLPPLIFDIRTPNNAAHEACR
ncbi:hypothetical protein GCK72_025342 [Caenorhabditis remanei]|uniref:Uncharacterized protein n=1 Tax=Caenorhabditis remanei TaxID=31234 RepID=A0A6A5G2H7_CAERE|nr:hypothetical protein GCK72_025342 [Caenorhabditis remanei]KAF1748875.1 hypothetical protein GCK72_025342 [Caenorhabditis remanei]